jgi:hypothetical protein
VVVPGVGQRTRTYTPDLGCNHDRRHKFNVTELGYPHTLYKPSSTCWTRSTDITLKISIYG